MIIQSILAKQFLRYSLLVFLPIVSLVAQASDKQIITFPLEIAISEDFEPYMFQKNGQWTGIDIEINQAIMSLMEITPNYIAMPWARQKPTAESGDVAAIINVYCNEESALLAKVTEPLYRVDVILFGLKDRAEVKTLDELPEGTRIGVVRGSYFSEEITKRPNLQAIFSPTTEFLPKQLKLDRIDYALQEDIPFLFYAAKTKDTQHFKSVMLLQQDSVCLTWSRRYLGEHTQLIVKRSTNAIRQLKEDGTIQRIIDKYTRD